MMKTIQISDNLSVSINTRGILSERVFDESNPRWSVRPEHNELFLRSQLQFFNDLIRIRPVILNDVYEALGFGRTSYGAVLGWRKGAPMFFTPTLLDTGAIRIVFNYDGVVIGEY